MKEIDVNFSDEEKAESKTNIELSVSLSKNEVKKIKSFMNLAGATSTQTTLKALITSASKGSLIKLN